MKSLKNLRFYPYKSNSYEQVLRILVHIFCVSTTCIVEYIQRRKKKALMIPQVSKAPLAYHFDGSYSRKGTFIMMKIYLKLYHFEFNVDVPPAILIAVLTILMH